MQRYGISIEVTLSDALFYFAEKLFKGFSDFVLRLAG